MTSKHAVPRSGRRARWWIVGTLGLLLVLLLWFAWTLYSAYSLSLIHI